MFLCYYREGFGRVLTQVTIKACRKNYYVPFKKALGALLVGFAPAASMVFKYTLATAVLASLRGVYEPKQSGDL